MIRHYLKVIWNRKRSNILVMIEILLAFVVVFVVAALAVYYGSNYQRPLGFSRADVWRVSLTPNGDSLAPTPAGDTSEIDIARQLLAAFGEFPEIVAVGGVSCPPYDNSNWISGITVGPREVQYGVNEVTDGFAGAMGLRLTRGRWFTREDDGARWIPVVLNEQLAQEVFGPADPVGKSLPRQTSSSGEQEPEMRVVGVVSEFRQDGELSDARAYMFQRQSPVTFAVTPGGKGHTPQNVVIKLRPGTTAAFEEKLVKRLQAAAPQWSFDVQTLEQLRATRFSSTLAPVAAIGTIAGFLLLMVAMGLSGVLWQTVTQRTREIGLRRAKGASIGDIRRQVFGELVMMTSVALAVGTALVAQVPLLRLFDGVPPGVYSISLVISVACIYLLTVACAWYPARMATAVPPAVALRYE